MTTDSYWMDSASLPRFPRLGNSLTVDVAIIGGGITGITAAYLCKQAGLSVALIERDRCARIDTGHTTAHLTAVTDLRLRDMTKTFGPDAARAVWDAGNAAIDQIVTNIRKHDIACDFKWVPGFLHAPRGDRSASTAETLRNEAAAAAALGIDAAFVEATPFFGGPAVEFAHQAIFHPRKYLSGLVRAIAGNGCHLFEQTHVNAIEGDDPITVKAGDFSVQCRHLILATHNPLMGKTGALSSALFQTKLALYTSYALSAKIPAGLIPQASFWDTNDPYAYLRVEHRRGYDYAIFGGEDHKTGQEPDTAAAYARLEKRFLDLVPDASIDHHWSGQVIETNDGLPFIGETAPRQFAATGFAGNGMTFGTLSAHAAVDFVLGRKNPWTDLFDPHRKKLLGGTWEYLKENKDYPYYMLRDWLGGSEGTSLSALQRSEGKILNLDGKKVAAFRDRDGKVSLCSPVCTHLKCIVAWNDAEQTWDCPCHGSRFKATGEVVSGPAESPLEKIPLE